MLRFSHSSPALTLSMALRRRAGEASESILDGHDDVDPGIVAEAERTGDRSLGAHALGDVIEECLDRVETQGRQHLRAALGGVRTVDHVVSRRVTRDRRRRP